MFSCIAVVLHMCRSLQYKFSTTCRRLAAVVKILVLHLYCACADCCNTTKVKVLCYVIVVVLHLCGPRNRLFLLYALQPEQQTNTLCWQTDNMIERNTTATLHLNVVIICTTKNFSWNLETNSNYLLFYLHVEYFRQSSLAQKFISLSTENCSSAATAT